VNGIFKELRGANSIVLTDFYLDVDPPPDGSTLPSGDEVVVEVAKDAELCRTAPASLGDFREGDKLIAYVGWSGGTLVASSVSPLYDSIEATVESVQGDRLETTSGTVVVTQHTTSGMGNAAPDVRRGSRIGANCLLDRESGDYFAGNLVILS
jgi:hypothetical protein